MDSELAANRLASLTSEPDPTLNGRQLRRAFERRTTFIHAYVVSRILPRPFCCCCRISAACNIPSSSARPLGGNASMS
jgi:hypothetical protein